MRSGPTQESPTPVTNLCLFYLRELHPKAFAEERAGYFFLIGLEVRFFECRLWPDPTKGCA
jgi:hypothetical protein